MLDFAVLAIFPGLMVYAAVSDMLTMRIPNRLSYCLIVAFFGLALWMGVPLREIGLHFLAGVIVLAICFVLNMLGWIGGGDAKLTASIAVWFGFAPLADYILTVSILGGVLTLVIVYLRCWSAADGPLAKTLFARLNLNTESNRIPYGIALAIAGLVVYPNTPIWTLAQALAQASAQAV